LIHYNISKFPIVFAVVQLDDYKILGQYAIQQNLHLLVFKITFCLFISNYYFNVNTTENFLLYHSNFKKLNFILAKKLATNFQNDIIIIITLHYLR